MKLTVETVNANDIQARITAAIQSGSGPDIFMTVDNLCLPIMPSERTDGEEHRAVRSMPIRPTVCAGR